MRLLYEQKVAPKLTYPKSINFPPHLHDAVELVFIEEGSFTVTHGTQRILMTAGEIFFAFPNRIHSYESSVDFKGYVLIIPTKPYLSAYREIWETCVPENPVITPDDKEQSAIQALLAQIGPLRNTASVPLLHGYALVLVGRLLPLLRLRPLPTDTDALQRTLHYIGEHYVQGFTRGELSRAVGYSESYISHLFANHLNTTLTGYITMLRLNDAGHMLRETALPVGQIAMSLGFPSIRSFNRFFRKEMHMTPTDYRNKKDKLETK